MHRKMASQVSVTPPRPSPSHNTGASSKPIKRGRVESFLPCGAKYAVPVLKLVRNLSAAFPVLGGAAACALSIAEAVKGYQSNQREWKSFGEYVQQVMASVIAVVADSPIPSGVELHIRQLDRVLIDIEADLQGMPKKRRTFLEDCDKINWLKGRLDRALEVFKMGTTLAEHQKIERILADTDRINSILGWLQVQMNGVISGTANTLESVDELHDKVDAATNTIAAIHADTLHSRSTFENAMDMTRTVHGEVLHANHQLTAMASDMTVHQASTSDQLSEIVAITANTRAMVEIVGRGMGGVTDQASGSFVEKMAGTQEIGMQLNGIEQAVSSGVEFIQDELAGLRRNMLKVQHGLDGVRVDVTEAARAGEQRQNIARLSYAEGASWDYFRACLPETCGEIVNDALSFLSSSHPSARILLLSGVAGCGKSTIAHTIAQCCHNHEKDLVLLTSFFFSSGSVGRSNPNRLFSTVARDLTSQAPSVKTKINDVIASKPAAVNMPISNQFVELVLGPAISCTRDLPKHLVIIIDAVDEGFSNDLLRILEEEIPKLPSNFRILITSRDHQFITPLRKCSHVTWRSIDIRQRSTRDDVAAFVRHRFEQIARRNELEDWPQEGAIDKFLKRAAGLFIWASVACNYIEQSISPREELDDLLQEALFDTNTIVQMDKLYTSILRNCPWNEGRFTRRFEVALGIVVVSARPLSARAIAVLLDIDNILDTYKPLGAIISGVFSSDQPLQLVHLSVREYLSDRAHKSSVLPDVSLEDQQKWAINEPRQHQNLALCCLRTLNKELRRFRSATNFVLKTPLRSSDVEPTEEADISEALRYACDFWIHHLVAAPSLASELEDAIEKFLREDFLVWMCLCATSRAFQGLGRAREWYKNMSGRHLVHRDTGDLTSVIDSLSLNLVHAGRLAEAKEVLEEGRHIPVDDRRGVVC